MSSNEKKRKAMLVAVIVIAVVIIGILIGVIMHLVKEPKEIADTEGGRGTVVTVENIEEVRQKRAEPIEDGYYNVTMNNRWTFQTAKTPSENAYVENSTSNKRTVYFDLILNDTEEVVYSSPYIPVGSKLTDFALDADVAPGEYKATVKYHLVDDDNTELTTLSIGATIVVLE